MTNIFIHPTAEVLSESIGLGSQIWQHVVILPKAVIGEDVNICAHCLIENDVVIGDRVTVKSGVYIWDGVFVGDDVFIGPNVTFCNDNFPRSKQYPDFFLKTIIESGATIGAGAILLGGITIGKGAMVAAGAVVTKSVPPFAVVKGSPARITRYIENNNVFSTMPNSQSINFAEDQTVVSINVKNVTLHRLKVVKDLRGDLSACEFYSDLPFIPKRYFTVFNVSSEKTRGEHAHYKCKQFLVCLKGSCAVVVDDGKYRQEILLNSPELGLYLPPLVWGIQYKFSADAVLLVLASEAYVAEDYIRSYSEFQRIIK